MDRRTVGGWRQSEGIIVNKKVISIGAILCGVAVLACVAQAQPQAGSVVAWGDNYYGSTAKCSGRRIRVLWRFRRDDITVWA